MELASRLLLIIGFWKQHSQSEITYIYSIKREFQTVFVFQWLPYNRRLTPFQPATTLPIFRMLIVLKKEIEQKPRIRARAFCNYNREYAIQLRENHVFDGEPKFDSKYHTPYYLGAVQILRHTNSISNNFYKQMYIFTIFSRKGFIFFAESSQNVFPKTPCCYIFDIQNNC